MSFSVTRIVSTARRSTPLYRVLASVPTRYSSSQAKQRMPLHQGSQVSISPSGNETPIDSATTGSAPVTRYPQDLAEEGPVAAASISGAPVELQVRTVRIYKPSKAATQSSNWPGQRWKMDWNVLPSRGNWENPLMGWTSSADHMQGTHLWFKTKEDAIHFAEKQGYEYFVQEPNVRAFRPKLYAANFVHSPGKLKVIRTK